MLDVNTIIPDMVADIVTLEPQFPDIVPVFPIAVLTPIDNGSGVILDGRESLTPVAFQIDVYDTSMKRCEELAHDIVITLIQRGFKRLPGQVLKEKGLHRHTLSFSGTVDERHGFIYRR